jgi:DNA-binding SARP family transcriptional activator
VKPLRQHHLFDGLLTQSYHTVRMTHVAEQTTALPRLQLLGMPGPTVAGPTRVRCGQKPLVLLARLVIEPRPVTREAMLAFLWPEVDEARARGSLRQALYVIRDVAGRGCVAADRQSLSVVRPPVADLLEFLSAVRSGDWERAALSYGGTLLDGVTVTDASDADLWLGLERRRLARLFETAATTVLEAGESAGVGDAYLVIARRFRDLSPRSVRSWRYLLAALERGHAIDALHLERAALGARIDTGQIDDPGAALLLLAGRADGETRSDVHVARAAGAPALHIAATDVGWVQPS